MMGRRVTPPASRTIPDVWLPTDGDRGNGSKIATSRASSSTRSSREYPNRADSTTPHCVIVSARPPSTAASVADIPRDPPHRTDRRSSESSPGAPSDPASDGEGAGANTLHTSPGLWRSRGGRFVPACPQSARGYIF